MRRMWHVWPGQLWPALPSQEARFAELLGDLTSGPGSFSRDDVSSLLGILRCGGDLTAAREFAPGLDLPALRGAFEALSVSLAASRGAWQAIVESPSRVTVLENADLASLLMPVPVHRVMYALEESEEVLRAVVSTLQEKIDDTCFVAAALENELLEVSPPSPMGIEIGARLYSATVPGTYADPFFLADRVAALSPVRVADLLTQCDMVSA